MSNEIAFKPDEGMEAANRADFHLQDYAKDDNDHRYHPGQALRDQGY
jgi:hypothetical protein